MHMRKLIRIDGTEVDLPAKLTMTEVRDRIGAEALDTVILADGVHVMLVDDSGAIDGKSVNGRATALYWQKCGGPVDWAICGDVVIVPDSDYAEAL